MFSGGLRDRFGCVFGQLLTAALAAAAGWGAQAAPPDGPPQFQEGAQVEAWSGGEAFRDVWSVYAGASWAPFGSILGDGLRLRGIAGYGGYRGGAVQFAELLAGTHTQVGSLTLKVLGGVAIAEHRPDDPLTGLAGTQFGAKGVLEAWWNIAEQAWVSTDLFIAASDIAHARQVDYGSRIRLGWRLWPALSLGLEGGSGGLLAPTWELATARVGGFVRYEWASGEISLSGGVSHDGAQGDGDDVLAPFGTVSILTRF